MPTSPEENLYLSRVEFLDERNIRNDPFKAVADAIWKLIIRNSMPPQPPPRFFSGSLRLNPITDAFVQTFYVVFPDTLASASTIAVIDPREIARHIIGRMINDANHAFDAYLISKVGQAAWTEALKLDSRLVGENQTQIFTDRNRLQAALNVFLVEVMTVPVTRGKRGFRPLVVGRESQAVEVSRLREREGTDPRVLALIQVLGDASVNPHVRESQSSRDNNTDNICILEGRSLRFFIIGPNDYDDIRVEHMPDNQWYGLKVLVPDLGSAYNQGRIQFILEDSSGNLIPPATRGLTTRWDVGSEAQGWQFSLQAAITRSDTRLSQIEGVPEMSPTIMMVGRVLPRRTRMSSPELESHLTRNNVVATTAIELEQGLFLYADDRGEVFLLSPTGNKQVNSASPSDPLKGHRLTNNADVEVEGVKYIWHYQNIAEMTVGWLEKRDLKESDVYTIRVEKRTEDTRPLLLGRQHQSKALEYSAEAIFPNNPDPYLSNLGNLLVRYVGRTAGKRTFRFSLLNTGNELPFLFKPNGPYQWRVFSWPQFNNSLRYDFEDADIVGEKNEIIFGTTFYRMKTSGTLPW